MIGKVSIGKTFGGCVHYVMEKDRAEILDEKGVRIQNAIVATQDFNRIRLQNPKIQTAVWHTSISFSYEDQVNNELMQKIAREYVQRIGLKGHQYLVVRHNDSKHQHLHIVANRVGYDGSITSDKWCKNRTARLCDHLEQEYQLTVARRHQRKDLSLDKITGKHRVKLEIRQTIQNQLDHGIRSMELLRRKLIRDGIEMRLYKRRNGKAYGVSFRKDGIAFKGSTIHRELSYYKLEKQLGLNRQADRGLGL